MAWVARITESMEETVLGGNTSKDMAGLFLEKCWVSFMETHSESERILPYHSTKPKGCKSKKCPERRVRGKENYRAAYTGIQVLSQVRRSRCTG